MARTGRRPGPTSTRSAILDAARQRFATDGFDGASIRAIATDAGVDAAVVLHFFGSKERLFQAAVGWPFDPAQVAQRIVGHGSPHLGEGIARVFFGFWEDPTTRASLLAVLRSAMSHAASATLLREFVARQLFSSVLEVVDGPHAGLRTDLAAAQLIGIAMLRYVLRVEPIASASVDDIVAWVTPALDHYLRKPWPGTDPTAAP